MWVTVAALFPHAVEAGGSATIIGLFSGQLVMIAVAIVAGRFALRGTRTTAKSTDLSTEEAARTAFRKDQTERIAALAAEVERLEREKQDAQMADIAQARAFDRVATLLERYAGIEVDASGRPTSELPPSP